MDASQINLLVEEYGGDIYSFCRRLTYDEFDTEELYQDTFLRAVDICDRIDMDNNPKSFLISIAVSLWNNKKRKYARRNRIAPTESLDTEENLNKSTSEETPEDRILKKELYDKVNLCVNELDEKMRMVILLYYNAEQSIETIARVLKVPKGTVKSRLFKAREILKKKMEVYGIE